MNLYFKASAPETPRKRTGGITEWDRFTKSRFLTLDLHPSYNKAKLAGVIFGG
jgi:hypothetical protein